MVSGTISLPSQGFFSPFPHGTGSLSVANEYLALGDGPPGFPQGFTCPAVLRNRLRVRSAFAYAAFTLCDTAFQRASASHLIGNSTSAGPTTSRPAETGQDLGCADFARHYFRHRVFFPFLQVLRWFTSLGGLHPAYVFSRGLPRFARQGFPIRRSPDQSLLAAPRSFSQLSTSFIACWRQGIHHTP